MSFLEDVAYDSMDNKKLFFKQNASYPNETNWLIALSSILSAFNGDYINALDSGKDNNVIADGCKNVWGFSDRNSFLAMCEWLVNEGHRSQYQPTLAFAKKYFAAYESAPGLLKLIIDNAPALGTMWLGFKEKNMRIALDAMNAGGETTKDFINQIDKHYPWMYQINKKGLGNISNVSNLLAWDAVRLVNISRWATQLGYIAENEFITYASALNDALKKTYCSWDEVILAFLTGAFIWNAADGRVKNMIRTTNMLKKDSNALINIIAFK